MEDIVSSVKKIVSSSNIELLKCIKYVFKYINRSYGGFIVAGFLSLTICFTGIFFSLQFSKIKIYLFNICQNYLSITFNSDNFP